MVNHLFSPLQLFTQEDTIGLLNVCMSLCQAVRLSANQPVCLNLDIKINKKMFKLAQ